MKLRNPLIFLGVLLVLFHFSPDKVEATYEDSVEIQTTEELGEEFIDQGVQVNDTEIQELAEEVKSEELEVLEDKSTEEEKVEVQNEANPSNSSIEEIEETENQSIELDSNEEETTEETKEDTVSEEEITILSTFSAPVEELELKYNVRDEKVIELKVNLAKLGFHVSNNPTSYFGSSTERAVKDFQAYYGVTGDNSGVAGPATLEKIEEILSSPFSYGNHHEHTITLKENLANLSYSISSNPTTYYGSSTKRTVEEFQRDHGLRVNGIADSRTWDKIESLLNGPMFKGMYRSDVVDLKVNLGKLGFHVSTRPTTYYGSSTERVVKEFQAYYGVSGDKAGVAGTATLSKIDEILASPFSYGKRHEQTITLKEKLADLGYQISSNPTTYFGSSTKRSVEEFQSKYGLRVNGIADSRTWAKIDELLNGPMFKGLYRSDVIDLKINLGNLGFHVSTRPTTYYGSSTEKAVKDFQSYYGVTGDSSGVAGTATVAKINELLTSPFSNGGRDQRTIKLKEDLAKLGFGVSSNPTNYYGSKTEKSVREFQKHFSLRVNGIADSKTFAKIEELLKTPLQVGKRHANTIKLKEDLAFLGYKVSSNPTTFYGDKTADQVKKFQSDNGLPVSGIADPITLDKLAKQVAKKVKEQKEEKEKKVKIFIDPGHGGTDSGASAYNLKEKDVVLDIGLSLAKELRTYTGVEVILSRAKDTTVSLSERTNAANKLGVNYFVSLHVNAFPNHTARGFESFIFNGSVSQETINRQKDIHNHLASWLKSNSGINDRGAKRANFHVLRESTMPAILLEYMFIDNYRENNLLTSKSYRQTLGKVTAEAIAKSFNLKK